MCHPASRASFCLLEKSRQVMASQTSGLVNLVFSRQTGFFKPEHPFIDKPMVITEPAVPSARALGLGSRLYPSNMQRMLNKDLTQFKQSLSRVRQNLESERKALLVGQETIKGTERASPIYTLFHR